MKPGVGLKYGAPVSPPPTTHSSDLGAYLRLMWQVCSGQIDVSPELQARCFSFFRTLDAGWDPKAWDGQPTPLEMTNGNLAGLTPRGQATAVLIYERLTPVGTPSKPGERVPNAPWWWLTWVANAGREQPVEKREAVLRDLWAQFKNAQQPNSDDLLKKSTVRWRKSAPSRSPKPRRRRANHPIAGFSSSAISRCCWAKSSPTRSGRSVPRSPRWSSKTFPKKNRGPGISRSRGTMAQKRAVKAMRTRRSGVIWSDELS
ncbi:MAG: hypothetical protein HC897_08535 [Thermoanaerobaculia bacterium]|nr:hypothetical protein [Thermoanaerobaculia bacterium]